MADVLAGPEARLAAIIEGTLDVSLLSPRAQLLRPAPGTFSRALNRAQLRDPRWQSNASGRFDRAYALYWQESRDEEDPDNELDPQGLLRVSVELSVGYLHGPALAPLLSTTGSETQAGASIDGTRRALSDAERLKRALTFFELHQAAPMPDPAIVLVARALSTTLEELSPERLLATTVYEMVLAINHATVYDP